jgi:hypothetical protein
MGRAANSIDGVEYRYWDVCACADTFLMAPPALSHVSPVSLACTSKNGGQALAGSVQLGSIVLLLPLVLAQLALRTHLHLQAGRVLASVMLGTLDPMEAHAMLACPGLTSRQWDPISVHCVREGSTQQVEMLYVLLCVASACRGLLATECRLQCTLRLSPRALPFEGLNTCNAPSEQHT